MHCACTRTTRTRWEGTEVALRRWEQGSAPARGQRPQQGAGRTRQGDCAWHSWLLRLEGIDSNDGVASATIDHCNRRACRGHQPRCARRFRFLIADGHFGSPAARLHEGGSIEVARLHLLTRQHAEVTDDHFEIWILVGLKQGTRKCARRIKFEWMRRQSAFQCSGRLRWSRKEALTLGGKLRVLSPRWGASAHGQNRCRNERSFHQAFSRTACLERGKI